MPVQVRVALAVVLTTASCATPINDSDLPPAFYVDSAPAVLPQTPDVTDEASTSGEYEDGAVDATSALTPGPDVTAEDTAEDTVADTAEDDADGEASLAGDVLAVQDADSGEAFDTLLALADTPAEGSDASDVSDDSPPDDSLGGGNFLDTPTDSDDADSPIPTDCTGLEDGVVCDDGDPCTDHEACLDEVCVGTPLDCVDEDPCTFDEICVDGLCEATSLADDKPCDGAGGCKYEGTCQQGACEPIEPLCVSEDPCKVGSCLGDGCVFENALNFTSCDDGDPCTDHDRCVTGLCLGSPKVCQDGEACTLDSCEPETGECLSETLEDCVPGTPTDFSEQDVNPYSATFEDDVSLASFADKLLLIVFHSPS